MIMLICAGSVFLISSCVPLFWCSVLPTFSSWTLAPPFCITDRTDSYRAAGPYPGLSAVCHESFSALLSHAQITWCDSSTAWGFCFVDFTFDHWLTNDVAFWVAGVIVPVHLSDLFVGSILCFEVDYLGGVCNSVFLSSPSCFYLSSSACSWFSISSPSSWMQSLCLRACKATGAAAHSARWTAHSFLNSFATLFYFKSF